MLRNRLVALAATAALLPLASVTAAQGVSSSTGVAQERGTAGARYTATIRRTEHGIPHVTARGFGSLGFGSGYAAAGTSLCTLADTLVTARGQRSRWFGPDKRYNDQVTLDASNLQVDAFVADLH